MAMLLILEMEPGPIDSQVGLPSSFNIDLGERDRKSLIWCKCFTFPAFLYGVVELIWSVAG